jgi:hypothetical protein
MGRHRISRSRPSLPSLLSVFDRAFTTREASKGLLHKLVTGRLGRLGGGWGHDRFELDGGQSAEGGLSASTVVGALGPGHDRDAQLLAGTSWLSIEHVLLQQREEGFHGGVVGRRCDLAH